MSRRWIVSGLYVPFAGLLLTHGTAECGSLSYQSEITILMGFYYRLLGCRLYSASTQDNMTAERALFIYIIIRSWNV